MPKILSRLVELPAPQESHHAARLADTGAGAPPVSSSFPGQSDVELDPVQLPAGSVVIVDQAFWSMFTLVMDRGYHDFPPGWWVKVVGSQFWSPSNFWLSVRIRNVGLAEFFADTGTSARGWILAAVHTDADPSVLTGAHLWPSAFSTMEDYSGYGSGYGSY